jgi:hypothetical protein
MIRATVLQQVRKMRFEEVYARQAQRERVGIAERG